MSLPPLAALPTTLQPLAERAVAQLPPAWPADREQALQRLCGLSDFVHEQAVRDPELLPALGASGELERRFAAGELRDQLQAWLADCADEEELGRRLRRFRNRQQVRIVWRDLTRQADLAETCSDLSDLADACIDGAYQWLYPRHCEQFGTPIGHRSGEPQHLVILGMGKLGAHELNLSSDIDLIFGYPEGGETEGVKRSLDNQEFFILVVLMIVV